MSEKRTVTGEQLGSIQQLLGLTEEQTVELLNEALGRKYSVDRLRQWKRNDRPVPKWVSEFLVNVAAEQNGVRMSEFAETLETGLGEQLLGGDGVPGDDAPPQPPTDLPRSQTPLSAGGAYAKICTDLWATLALSISSVGALANRPVLVRDGQIIDRDKEALGKAWGKLAETNETFRRMLDQTLTGGAWLEITVVTGVTAGKLLDNHRTAAALAAVEAEQDATVRELRRDGPAAA